MKRITLQLTDATGIVEDESEILLGDNDTLIMQYPEGMKTEHVRKAFNIVKSALENGTGIIGIPNSLTFKVIKKEISND